MALVSVFSLQWQAPGDFGLKHLKRWIHAGVPVIVAVDEGGQWYDLTEHFKVLVGYDDHAHYRYTDDDGIEHVADGALYFLNSGLQGETREDVESVDAERRENHPDYGEVPIGNGSGRVAPNGGSPGLAR